MNDSHGNPIKQPGCSDVTQHFTPPQCSDTPNPIQSATIKNAVGRHTRNFEWLARALRNGDVVLMTGTDQCECEYAVICVSEPGPNDTIVLTKVAIMLNDQDFVKLKL